MASCGYPVCPLKRAFQGDGENRKGFRGMVCFFQWTMAALHTLLLVCYLHIFIDNMVNAQDKT